MGGSTGTSTAIPTINENDMKTTLHPNLIISSSKAYNGLFSKIRGM